MVLERHRRHPRRHPQDPARAEQRQHALARMCAHDRPLGAGELGRLVEHFERHRALAQIVEERRQPDVGELELRIADAVAERHRQERDVDRVVLRILVVRA